MKKTHFISYLFKQNEKDFSITFDTTFTDIAATSIKIFSISTIGREKIPLFEELSENIREKNERSPFCKAIINKLVAFSFEPVFKEKWMLLSWEQK